MLYIKDNVTKITGLLFLLPLLFYGTGSALISPVIDVPNYTISKVQLISGTICILANSVTVVALGAFLFPVLKRHSLIVATSYLCARVSEAVLLIAGLAGIFAWMSTNTADNIEYDAVSGAMRMLAIRNNYFTYQAAMMFLGLGSIPLCILLYRSSLVPRAVALWGIVCYTLLFAGAVLEICGLNIGVILSVPGGLFELFLAGWLFFNGFYHSPVAQRDPLPDTA